MRHLLALLVLLPATHALRAYFRRRLKQPRNEVDVVVKFGGSAMTDKGKFETLAGMSLQTASSAIASGKARCVVIHGAGSFGHFQAREFGVSKGTAHPSFSWEGFAATRASVCKLNGLVVSSLLAAGVAAVGVPPFPMYSTRGKGVVPRRAQALGLDRLRSLLSAGLTPVLHGDAVLDELQGCSILSGDTLTVLVALALRPRLAVFLTDVAGVYDRPPSEEGATLLERIAVARDGTLRVTARTSVRSDVADVTGGLQTKLEAAAELARHGVPVVIVQVDTEHAATALRGEVPRVCTLVSAEDQD